MADDIHFMLSEADLRAIRRLLRLPYAAVAEVLRLAAELSGCCPAGSSPDRQGSPVNTTGRCYRFFLRVAGASAYYRWPLIPRQELVSRLT